MWITIVLKELKILQMSGFCYALLHPMEGEMLEREREREVRDITRHVHVIMVANHAPFPILHAPVNHLAFYSWSWEVHMELLIQICKIKSHVWDDPKLLDDGGELPKSQGRYDMSTVKSPLYLTKKNLPGGQLRHVLWRWHVGLLLSQKKNCNSNTRGPKYIWNEDVACQHEDHSEQLNLEDADVILVRSIHVV